MAALAVPKKVQMTKAAELGWVETGAGKELGWSRSKARKGRSKAGARQ